MASEPQDDSRKLTAEELATTIERVLDLSMVVEPAIMAHLAELRMDTDEDNALLDELRRPMVAWANAVQAFRRVTDAGR